MPMLASFETVRQPIDDDVSVLLMATGIDKLPRGISTRQLNNLVRWLTKEKAFGRQEVFVTDLPERMKSHLKNGNLANTVSYRTERPCLLFGGTEFAEGTGLRDFLFTVDLAHEKHNLCDASISKLRLYLAELNWQAILKGFDKERNIDYCCQMMAKGLVNRSELGLKILDEYIKLNQQNTHFKIKIWLQRLNLILKGSSNLDAKQKKDLNEFIQNMGSAVSGNFKHLINTATRKRNAIPLEVRITTLKNKAQANLPVVTKGLRPGQPQIAAIAQANIESYNRLQNSFLINDPAARYYWPEIVSAEFSECCKDLLNTSLIDQEQIPEQFITGLISKIASITGLTFQQILMLKFSRYIDSLPWHISIEQNHLILTRARPARTGSIALPEKLIKYCAPIGTELKIEIHQFKTKEQASTIQGLVKEKSVNQILFELAAGDFLDHKMTASLEKFILRNLPNRSFYTEIGIRRQAYKSLIILFDEPTAELCLAQAQESTSAITGYLSYLNADNVNIAGSKLALTKSGIRDLVKTITDQTLESLEELPDRVDPLEIFNIVTSRLYILQLICTGMRPVRTGIQSSREIDLENRLALICDKYVKGIEEIRVVPLVDKLIKEIDHLRKLLEKLSTNDRLPFSVRKEIEEMISNTGKTPLWMSFSTTRQGIFAKEINAKVALHRFAPMISEVPNIFRHFMAQQVFAESKSIELAMAALGHSDSVRLLYGPASTRCRKEDVEQICKIMNSALSRLEFRTDEFWNLVHNKLAYPLPSANSSSEQKNSLAVYGLNRWGHERRGDNRQRDEQNRIKKIEKLLDQYKENIEGEISQEQAEELLKDILLKHPTIRKTSLNAALKIKKWPAAVSTFSTSQLFPSLNLIENLQRRAYFENWFRKHSNEFTRDEQLAAKLIKLIYFHGAYSRGIAIRSLDPNQKSILEDIDGTIYLQISRFNVKLNTAKNTQIFRIPISRNMLDLGTADLTEISTETKNLKRLIANYQTDAPLRNFADFVTIVCDQARDIALYDQPAFQSNALRSDLPGASTTFATILSMHDMPAPRIQRAGETAQPKKSSDDALTSENIHSHAETNEIGTNGSPDRKRSIHAQGIKQLRNALKNQLGTDLKNSLQELSLPTKNLSQDFNWRHVIGWTIYSIFDNSGPQLKPKSVLRYLRSTLEVLKVLHGANLYLIEHEEIEIYLSEYLNWLNKERDRDSLKHGLRSFLMYLEKRVNSDFADFELGITEKVKTVNANWITPIQYQKVIQFLWDSRKKDNEALEKIRFLSVQYRFGMRINEVIGMEFGDLINFDYGLIGVTVRKNRDRDIKNDKPPRYIFLDQLAVLSNIEDTAWRGYISSTLKRYFQVPRNLKVFTKFTGKTIWQEQFKNQIRSICANPNLTFHSFRKGFAQTQFSQRVQIAQNFLTFTGLPNTSFNAASRALDPLRRYMGHVSLDTTFVSYIHTLDQVIKQATKGRRRGYTSCEDLTAYEQKVTKLKELAKPQEASQERSTTTELARNETDKTSIYAKPKLPRFNLYRIKELIRVGTVQVHSEEVSFLSTLIESDIGYHPEAPKIALQENQLKIITNRKNSFQVNENFQSLIQFLDTIDDANVQADQCSTLNMIVAKSGEIVLRNKKDFEFLKFFGKKLPADFGLYHPSSLTKEQANHLESQFKKSPWESRLHSTPLAMPNEVSANRLRSPLRVSLRSSQFRKPHDMLFLLMAVILVQAEKQKTNPSKEQEKIVASGNASTIK